MLQWYEQSLNLESLPPAAESRALVGAAVMWYSQGELGRARTGLPAVSKGSARWGFRGVLGTR
jgi:hypothetical protein